MYSCSFKIHFLVKLHLTSIHGSHNTQKVTECKEGCYLITIIVSLQKQSFLPSPCCLGHFVRRNICDSATEIPYC